MATDLISLCIGSCRPFPTPCYKYGHRPRAAQDGWELVLICVGFSSAIGQSVDICALASFVAPSSGLTVLPRLRSGTWGTRYFLLNAATSGSGAEAIPPAAARMARSAPRRTRSSHVGVAVAHFFVELWLGCGEGFCELFVVLGCARHQRWRGGGGVFAEA